MKHLKWLAGLAAMALLLSSPQDAARGAARAMAQWHASVAPALFPFLALMPLLTSGEAMAAYEALLSRFMGACFNLPGAAAPGMIAGMVAGTPAGALAARNIAARGDIDRGQLQRLAAATAGFSPAFLVGGIGAGMLNSAAAGWRLMAAQLLTQVALLTLLRHRREGRVEPVAAAGGAVKGHPIRGAVQSILTVCGYMTLFGALTGVAGRWIGQGASNLALCLLDVPSGAVQIGKLPLPEGIRAILMAGMCGFGGLCLIAQSLDALKGCGVSAGAYIAVRALAGLLGAGFMAALQGLPSLEDVRWIDSVRRNPLATGALMAALLAIPVLKRQMNIASNNVKRR